MFTDVLKVPGNYIVKAANGNITLDSPLTVVSGNLTVLGATTTVESTDATIKDNILVLNSGETNPYVSLGTAGILIGRGNSDSPSSAASLIYDDTVTNTFENRSLRGVWNFGSTLNTYGHVINVSAITIPTIINTLTFFSSVNPNAVLSVKGTTNYENNVIDADHIPNKAYVDALLASTEFAEKLQVGNTYIELTDNSVPITNPYYGSPNKITMAIGTLASEVVLEMQGSVAQFVGLKLTDNRVQVRNTVTNVDLGLEPGPGGIVKMTTGLKIEKTAPIPSEAGYTAIYSTSTVGGGGTGIHYVNTADTDELVSRRRSIVYSIIF
jgi:hypothetical protein